MLHERVTDSPLCHTTGARTVYIVAYIASYSKHAYAWGGIIVAPSIG